MSPKLITLYRYWQSRHRPDGRLPRRCDIDPIALARQAPALMPHLWLLDVLRNPYRFRYRLVGGALVEAGAPGRVGEFVDRVGGGAGSHLHDNLVRICEERHWNYRKGLPTLPHSTHVEQVERLSLPLVDEADAVVIILSASVYRWQEGWGAAT
jgi:hypothetical protein